MPPGFLFRHSGSFQHLINLRHCPRDPLACGGGGGGSGSGSGIFDMFPNMTELCASAGTASQTVSPTQADASFPL